MKIKSWMLMLIAMGFCLPRCYGLYIRMKM
ncbi:hypothetical protein T285_08835 [Lactobacillus johnsonii N6.2]|uniref:Uncharacterized protein n=1 Tax=Lactobacillus johnsonii N6.2 TaxID=1408186 RepID=A0A7D9N8V3_LACJH|nr:hypothetical protein T285_08835 [Lactobacillus johnsonii N6.2]